MMSSDTAPTHQSKAHTGILSLLAFACIAVLGYCTVVGVTHTGNGDYPHFYNSGIALEVGDSLYLGGADQPVPPYVPEGGGYIYPPMLAIVFRPFVELPFEQSRDLWIILNMILLGGCTYLLASRHASLYIDHVSNHVSKKQTMLTSLAISGLACFFLYDTIIAQAKLAQTDVFLIFWMTAAYLAYPKRPLLAGLMISVPIAIKYVTVVFLLYFILRKEYRATAGVVIGVLFGFFAPALYIGWEHNLTELQAALSGMLNMLGIGETKAAANIHELTWERSVSIPSGFARFAEFAGLGFSATLAMTAATAAGCLGIGWLLYKKMGSALLIRKDRVQGVIDAQTMRLVSLEWSLLCITFLIFSPQTTKRHMIMLLLPMILTSTLLLVPKAKQSITRYPLLIGVFLVMIGSVMPPASAENALAIWRSISGLSMCVAIFTVALIWTTLKINDRERTPTAPVQ
ncbi:MAG: glycosyltransferase family 87 protein [Phycisphaerales bacterium]